MLTPDKRQLLVIRLDDVIEAVKRWAGEELLDAVLELRAALLDPHFAAPRVWLNADFAGIEARIAAFYSGDVVDCVEVDGVFVPVTMVEYVCVNRMQDQPALRSLTRRCWPKEQCKTQGAAEAQMRSITRRNLEKDMTLIHVYECPDCLHPETGKPAWHVGHGRGGDK